MSEKKFGRWSVDVMSSHVKFIFFFGMINVGGFGGQTEILATDRLANPDGQNSVLSYKGHQYTTDFFPKIVENSTVPRFQTVFCTMGASTAVEIVVVGVGTNWKL